LQPLVKADPTWDGVYGQDGKGWDGGHVCWRCCQWRVNSFFSTEDVDLCQKCEKERVEAHKRVIAGFHEPDVIPICQVEIDPGIIRRLRLITSTELASCLVGGLDAAHLLAVAEELPAGAVRDHLVELSIHNDTPQGMLSLAMLEHYFPQMRLPAEKIARWEAADQFPRRDTDNPPLWRQDVIDAWYSRWRRR
jgi:hypothetical protein